MNYAKKLIILLLISHGLVLSCLMLATKLPTLSSNSNVSPSSSANETATEVVSAPIKPIVFATQPTVFAPSQPIVVMKKPATVVATPAPTVVATPAPSATSSLDQDVNALSQQAPNLDPKIIRLGLIAYRKAAKQGVTQKKILTVVDYSQPSTQRRLWVFDLTTHRLLFNELVAHGKNSGENKTVTFSNAPSSDKSSLGVFVTGQTYDGKHGYSLKLAGLEPGFNSNAAARAIVMHPANYVNYATIKQKGRLGRSWGCLALDPTVATPVINAIKNGTVIFSYYPDQNYLKHSQFVAF